MPEYAFPSGIRILDVNQLAARMFGLNASLVFLLAASIGIFVWRCRRPANLWDVHFWIAVLAADVGIVIWFSRISTDPRGLLVPAFLLTLLMSAIGIAVTTVRRANKQEYTPWIIFGVVAVYSITFILPAIDPAREGMQRTRCKNNLKQISLAMFNYEAAYRRFPFTGAQMPDSEANHSWRVSIVPFFDSAPDFLKYRFDEAWDSEQNQTFQKNRPAPYQCPSHPTDKPFSAYAMLTGVDTFGGDSSTGLKVEDITDGTTNTLMIVEACGRDIIWTEPRDVEVTAESLGVNLPGNKPGHSRGIISSYHAEGAHVLFADGTVRFLSEKIDKDVLKALTTVNGNETLPENW